jgi:hypothetical protein
MSTAAELFEKQLSAIDDRLDGIKALARLAFEGEGNGVEGNVLASALLMIEREASTISQLVTGLALPDLGETTEPPPSGEVADLKALRVRRAAKLEGSES